MGQFRYTVWDPWMISAQIITLQVTDHEIFGVLPIQFFFQAVFYLFLGAWVLGLDLLLGSPYSLDQLFSYKVESPYSLGLYCTNISGAGWEPRWRKTPHSWIHLQLSHLLTRTLVHCPEDQAMPRLFLHGLLVHCTRIRLK